jgi:SAM-dependent methyltransferase
VAQDSSRPDFWDTRYRGRITPWDASGVPQHLAAWLESKGSSLRVLVPGCGAAYEVRAFAEHGHDVLAIDFSDAAIEAAQRELGNLASRVRKADFFALEEKEFDVVYERAFLCALPRPVWPRWAARVAELVRPGVAPHALKAFLDGSFHLAEELEIPASQSIPVFQGKERWQVWKRRL